MQKALSVVSHSEEETAALAQRIAVFLRPGDTLVLTGQLGAGKTVFVRGLAKGLGIDEDSVNSPSFTMVNEYPGGKLPLYHFALYRIGDTSELTEIGWYDYLGRDGIVVVEWGEKAEGYLPGGYYQVIFAAVGEAERQIDISFVEAVRP